MKKNQTLSEIRPLVEGEFGQEMGSRIMDGAWEQFDRLCRENPGQSKAVRKHTVEKIYPCVALYLAMQEEGFYKGSALSFLDWSFSKMAEKQAKSIQSLMKIPGMYRLMPRIFTFVAKNQFGEKAGFRAKFYPTDGKRSKFDMTQCLYCDECRRLNCPELTVCFCHTDDVTDGNMHPRICWNRTQIMGDGAEFCDFDLFITEKESDHGQ